MQQRAPPEDGQDRVRTDTIFETCSKNGVFQLLTDVQASATHPGFKINVAACSGMLSSQGVQWSATVTCAAGRAMSEQTKECSLTVLSTLQY